MVLKNPHLSQGFILFLVISFILTLSPTVIKSSKAIEVTPNTRVEMHDIVVVNYTLWISEIPEEPLTGTIYVEDPDIIERVGVPDTIIEEFPDVYAPPNLGFVEGILGMKAGEEKNFEVLFSSGKAFNNATRDPDYYGKDLFYQIRLKKILLDASTPTVTLMDLPFFVPLVVLIGLLITFLIILRIQRYSRTHDLFGLKKKCYYCGKLANVMCGNLGCTTPYCKQCFFQNNGCDLCHSNTMIPLK
ncbi:MAG: hypothetical protein ACFFAE_05455 [Candidatus Hodarchaeota archaeon]